MTDFFASGAAPSVAKVEVKGLFGHYLLGEPLSVVTCTLGKKFHGLDLGLGRRVVLWRLTDKGAGPSGAAGLVPGAAWPSSRRALASQVERLRALRHPRLCPILASELLQSGELYAVMGFAPGGSVAEWLADSGPLDAAGARRVVRAAAEGLRHLHDCGQVHGSLHCGNVLLGPGAAIRLSDFGLRPLLGGSSVATAHAGGRGVPAWLAPEVEADGRFLACSDVWAYGCALVEMLTGRPPWDTELALMTDRASEAQDSMQLGLPSGAHNLARRCLQPRPVARPLAVELLADPWLAA